MLAQMLNRAIGSQKNLVASNDIVFYSDSYESLTKISIENCFVSYYENTFPNYISSSFEIYSGDTIIGLNFNNKNIQLDFLTIDPFSSNTTTISLLSDQFYNFSHDELQPFCINHSKNMLFIGNDNNIFFVDLNTGMVVDSINILTLFNNYNDQTSNIHLSSNENNLFISFADDELITKIINYDLDLSITTIIADSFLSFFGGKLHHDIDYNKLILRGVDNDLLYIDILDGTISSYSFDEIYCNNPVFTIINETTPTNINKIELSNKLISIKNILGQKSSGSNGIKFHYYKDGTVEKRIILE